jgi:predicted membrane-bound mannosyltransferase
MEKRRTYLATSESSLASAICSDSDSTFSMSTGTGAFVAALAKDQHWANPQASKQSKTNPDTVLRTAVCDRMAAGSKARRKGDLQQDGVNQYTKKK